jgi:hypothetical protein
MQNLGKSSAPLRAYQLEQLSRAVRSTYDDHYYVKALYEKADDCVADRDASAATFQAATGIERLIAYCIHDRCDADVDNGWAMRIDGFCQAKLSLQHVARDFYSGIHGDVNVLELELKTTLKARCAHRRRLPVSDFLLRLFLLYVKSLHVHGRSRDAALGYRCDVGQV